MKVTADTPLTLVVLWLSDGTIQSWDDHYKYPVGDWQYEVENDNTRQGYWDWVVSEMEAGD